MNKTEIEKSIKPRSLFFFFEMVNKTNKPLVRLTKKKRERTQLSKVRNLREITFSTTGKKKTVREYYEQLSVNKLNNLEEADKFLKINSPPKLNQEEIYNLNVTIIRTEIKNLI